VENSFEESLYQMPKKYFLRLMRHKLFPEKISTSPVQSLLYLLTTQSIENRKAKHAEILFLPTL